MVNCLFVQSWWVGNVLAGGTYTTVSSLIWFCRGILGEGGFCTASKGRYAENIKFASIDPKISISCEIYRYILIKKEKTFQQKYNQKRPYIFELNITDILIQVYGICCMVYALNQLKTILNPKLSVKVWPDLADLYGNEDMI